MRLGLGLVSFVLSSVACAQDALGDQPSAVQKVPEVGKHVMANMDVGSMILSLLMVLALIIVSAFVLKRFNLVQQSSEQLSIVTSLPLGAKERVVVVQVGQKQLLLGVTAHQVTLLESLTEPLIKSKSSTANVPFNIASFLSSKKTKKSDIAG